MYSLALAVEYLLMGGGGYPIRDDTLMVEPSKDAIILWSSHAFILWDTLSGISYPGIMYVEDSLPE